MNKVILVGRLTKDPEVRYTNTGKVVATFTLAVDRFTGQDKKETDFIPIVVWGKVAEVCGNNVTKGQKILVDGRLQVRTYENKEGRKCWATEVVAQTVNFLEWKSKENDSGFTKQVHPVDDTPSINTFDDDMPF